jgi:hypothetical protein
VLDNSILFNAEMPWKEEKSFQQIVSTCIIKMIFA